MSANKVDNRKLRSFGLIVGACFAVLALLPTLLRSESPRMWALSASIVLLTLALVFPPALRTFRQVWMILGEALGWVNSRILLSVIYYVLIVPIGVIQRMSRKDAMRRKFEPNAETYKVPRAGRPASHMQRQY